MGEKITVERSKTGKGQFMLISAIVVGLIIISATNMVSEANNRNLENSNAPYIVQNLKEEAKKVDLTKKEDRENFEELVEEIDRYQTEVSHWKEHNPQCINITLKSYNEKYKLTCLT